MFMSLSILPENFGTGNDEMHRRLEMPNLDGTVKASITAPLPGADVRG
jgi:hypothetical protein